MTEKTGEKTIVIVSDLHCGSEVGLKRVPKNKTQAGLLKAWQECISIAGIPDILIVNGDAVDGQDRKGLSTDEPDVPEQVSDAYDLLILWKPKKVIIVEGSSYHTGDTVQQEKFLAGYIEKSGTPCEFHTKLRAEINGWFKLQARHKISRSINPYGMFTSPYRSQTHQVINSAIEARYYKKPVKWTHLSVFSHAHYWAYAETAQGSVAVTPCWAATGSRFGDLNCDGHIDIGCMWLKVGATEEDGWSYQRRLYPARLESRTVSL